MNETPPPFVFHDKQRRAWDLIGSDARHILLFGGSRSGKTVLNIQAVTVRATAVPSKHCILRFRQNAVRRSILLNTLPFVLDRCFPGLRRHPATDLQKQEMLLVLPTQRPDSDRAYNDKSEIWLGGLDDKERVEKILGNEYSTLFFNEISEIPWQSRNVGITRLAQTTDLRLKALYDENPPAQTHWSHRLFIEHKDPETLRNLGNPLNYASLQINPEDNKANLDPEYLEELQQLPARQRRRFYDGLFGDPGQAALWTYELLDQQRMLNVGADDLPDFVRVVVAVDPSGADNAEDADADEIGIVAAALGTDGKAYVLEDATMKGSPNEWATAANELLERHDGDVIVAEVNFGGAMVKSTIRGVNPTVTFKEVRASRGKVVRAEPVANLYEAGKVMHVGRFQQLEDELCGFTTFGYTGDRSPNRADALVWAITELFPKIVKKAKEEARGGRTPKVLTGRHGVRTRSRRR